MRDNVVEPFVLLSTVIVILRTIYHSNCRFRWSRTNVTAPGMETFVKPLMKWHCIIIMRPVHGIILGTGRR